MPLPSLLAPLRNSFPSTYGANSSLQSRKGHQLTKLCCPALHLARSRGLKSRRGIYSSFAEMTHHQCQQTDVQKPCLWGWLDGLGKEGGCCPWVCRQLSETSALSPAGRDLPVATARFFSRPSPLDSIPQLENSSR